VERSLEPLGLVIKGGVWYLVALADGQPRTYRVSRVLSVIVEESRFERPEAFDLAAFWTETTAAYEARADRIEIRLRVEPEHLAWLADALGEETLQAAVRIGEPDPDGWVHLRLVAEWPRDVHARMLALGAFAEVLDPPELRERMITSARDLLARYQPAPVRELVSATAGGSAGPPPSGVSR
jgi:predicted DNA-binding transcriptional regulator YafY